MCAGVARYAEEDIFLDLETVKNMNASFEGKPIYIDHKDVDLETLKEDAVGYVVRSFYNPLDGWSWAEIIITDDEGFDAVSKGWAVSNAYIPVEWSGAGTNINVSYNRKITKAEYTHLAIVPNPRYESAVIMTRDEYNAYNDELKQNELTNSNRKGIFMKFFKRKEEVVNSDEDLTDAYLKLEDGREVSVKEMINAVEEKQNSDKEEVKMDAKVKVNGKDMSVKDLVSEYQNMCKEDEKSNEDEEDEKSNEDESEKSNMDEDSMDEKGNEEEEEKENEEDEKEKSNSKHFDALKNAKGGSFSKALPLSASQREQLGKELY